MSNLRKTNAGHVGAALVTLDAVKRIELLDKRGTDKASGFADSLISTAGTIGAEAPSQAARAAQLAIDAGR